MKTTPEVASMRAAVLVEPGRFALQQVPAPTPAPHEVRVRIESCGVCASNVPPWEGRPWFEYPFPAGAPGHEATGVIESVGAEVERWQPGARVAFLSSRSFAEYDVASAAELLALPAALGDTPFMGEPLGCALNIFRRAEIEAGQLVAIVGVGFLGALLIQLARASGARVVAIARSESALAIARSLGAEAIAFGEKDDVLRALGGPLCDVVIEATGKQAPLDFAAELTRIRGRLVIAGYHQDGLRQVNLQLWNWRGLDVINAHERDPQIYLEGMQLALDAVLAGRLPPGPLITHRFPLEELDRALAFTRDRPDGFMKAMIVL